MIRAFDAAGVGLILSSNMLQVPAIELASVPARRHQHDGGWLSIVFPVRPDDSCKVLTYETTAFGITC